MALTRSFRRQNQEEARDLRGSRVREDKHPIQRVMDLLDEVGARFLAIWFMAALVALLFLTLVLVSN
jgi:hypothetical protein